ncbi:MAG: CotH kinase family protein, partial [Clostridia bacterium]|nr:CotH kinase family protein [Clostridia bacterium]
MVDVLANDDEESTAVSDMTTEKTDATVGRTTKELTEKTITDHSTETASATIAVSDKETSLLSDTTITTETQKETTSLTRSATTSATVKTTAATSAQEMTKPTSVEPLPTVNGKTDGLGELYISEAMSSNKSYAPVNGKYYDFVEIYNNSDSAINLGDYYLTDNKDEPKKYKLPDDTLDPGGYYLIYCSGLDTKGHAGFKITSAGEDIYLLKDGEIVDKLSVPSDLKQDQSYGRNGSDLVYMTVPTPGSANSKGEATTLKAPQAEPAAGAYDHAVNVVLSGEGTIYYTLDGTEPTSSSKKYSDPIKVEKMASVRAVSIKNGVKSPLASYFYLVNVNHEYPVIDVAIKQEYLTGSEGVLNHVKPEYEHEAYVTMMKNGKEIFSAPCGFKLHGNGSKKLDKQNFQLRFRSEYGLSKLECKLFENRSYKTFNSLILHGGSEDYNIAGFRDELCTSLVDGVTNLYVLACRPVVLYLNGQYWGIYWLRERFDAQYVVNNLGGSKSSVDLLPIYGYSSVGSETGDKKEYLALLDYCKSHDLKKEENYKYVMAKIDATSLMDWYI